MILVNRFRIPDPDASTLRLELERVRALLGACEGYVAGALGRNLDEPDLWALTTIWVNVGSGRRALSSYDVRLALLGLAAHAVNEPSAYEVVEPGQPVNQAASRG